MKRGGGCSEMRRHALKHVPGLLAWALLLPPSIVACGCAYHNI